MFKEHHIYPKNNGVDLDVKITNVGYFHTAYFLSEEHMPCILSWKYLKLEMFKHVDISNGGW